MAAIFDGMKVLVAFCTPCPKIRLANGQEILDTITMQWHRKRTALALGTNVNFVELHEDGKEVGVARDSAARRCLKMEPVPEFLFFLDYDVLPEFDAFTKLVFRARCFPNYDVYAGVYTCKWANPSDPLIYAGDGGGAFWDWALGDLLTTEGHGITGTHMGLTLIRTSLFQRMLDAKVVKDDEPFFKTVKETWKDGGMKSRSGTEDLYFYQLARKVDCKIMVDTSVLAGHIDKRNGITYGLPPTSPGVERGKWYQDKDKEETSKLALDIGAGGRRREWPGYKTYTTDIRADAKPDYVQDTRWLNLPDNHFDLVASSHHLEHLGRFDQEQVWREMFRILKPGGKMEHIVPSLDWAGHKLQAGVVDEHVYNVLYGAQEAHGYAREYNLHYFGYTAKVAQALAEECGLVNVQVRDWRQEPGLGYNLVITGDKPAKAQEATEKDLLPEETALRLTTSRMSSMNTMVMSSYNDGARV